MTRHAAPAVEGERDEGPDEESFVGRPESSPGLTADLEAQWLEIIEEGFDDPDSSHA